MAFADKTSGKILEANNNEPKDASLRLAAIVDSSDDAIVSKDLNGIVKSWNAAATRIFGYLPEEIIGKSILTIIPAHLHHEEVEVIRKIRAGQRIEHFETVRRCKDGSLRHVSLTISPIRNEHGIVVGAFKIARDIAEKKQLDRARLHLAAIVESSDDAIASKDLDGIITSWNNAAERLFGWKADEIIGRPVLTIIPPFLHHEEPEILRRLRAGERIEHHETKRLHKDGKILDVSLTVSPIKDDHGNVVGGSKILRDISDRKRMEKALIESEKLAATGRMAAAIAHEINNPLESVTNLAYLLSIDQSLSERARGFAQLLLQEVSRASDITRQTLAFYRDSTHPTDVDLALLVDNLLDLNRPRLQSKEIEIVREFNQHRTVFGFAAELRQVIANLLLNAVDAVGRHGILRIRIGLAAGAPDFIRLSVADNGPGIPSELRYRLFEPFFTTKGSGGNGLGLWVTRGIVEKHHGEIQVRSRRTQGCSGTVFSVLIPRKNSFSVNP